MDTRGNELNCDVIEKMCIRLHSIDWLAGHESFNSIEGVFYSELFSVKATFYSLDLPWQHRDL